MIGIVCCGLCILFVIDMIGVSLRYVKMMLLVDMVILMFGMLNGVKLCMVRFVGLKNVNSIVIIDSGMMNLKMLMMLFVFVNVFMFE